MKLLKNKVRAMDRNEDDEKGSGAHRKYKDRDGGTGRGDRGRDRDDGAGRERDDDTGRRDRDDGASRRERGNVFDRLDMGRSWNRAEERMERQRGGRRFKTESPRKMRSGHGDRDLRVKLKKSLKCHNLDEPSDNVTFTKPSKSEEYETDSLVLGRRDKQIEYGKNTIDYDTYCRIIPKDQRKPTMPRTPIKHRKYSRRQWDGMIKNWKQMIHKVVARYNENNEADLEGPGEEGVTSWADQVEEEEMMEDRRRRLEEEEEEDDDWRTASTSTHQGLGISQMSSASSLTCLDME